MGRMRTRLPPVGSQEHQERVNLQAAGEMKRGSFSSGEACGCSQAPGAVLNAVSPGNLADSQQRGHPSRISNATTTTRLLQSNQLKEPLHPWGCSTSLHLFYNVRSVLGCTQLTDCKSVLCSPHRSQRPHEHTHSATNLSPVQYRAQGFLHTVGAQSMFRD